MKSGSTLDARTRRAEREGFEPSIRVSTYAGLANRCLQPLGYLSGRVMKGIGAKNLLQPSARAAPLIRIARGHSFVIPASTRASETNHAQNSRQNRIPYRARRCVRRRIWRTE